MTIYLNLAVGLIGLYLARYGKTSYHRAVGGCAAALALLLVMLSPMAW